MRNMSGIFERKIHWKWNVYEQKLTHYCYSEPGVIEPFAKLWGTDELVVSFDTVNITLPANIVGGYDSKPWPHCDQPPSVVAWFAFRVS